jgi:AcrR family transcriptional regulator
VPVKTSQSDTQRRQAIKSHALRLFSRHGFERTSVGMIARSANVSQGLLYNYFASKDALLAELFEESMRDVRDSFAVADQAAQPHERIERLVRGAFDILKRHADFWRLSYGVRMQPRVLASLGGALPAWTAEIRRTLTTYMREADVQDPEVEAEILFALIDGVSQHYVLEPNRYPLDAIADRIITRYRASTDKERT